MRCQFAESRLVKSRTNKGLLWRLIRFAFHRFFIILGLCYDNVAFVTFYTNSRTAIGAAEE